MDVPYSVIRMMLIFARLFNSPYTLVDMATDSGRGRVFSSITAQYHSKISWTKVLLQQIFELAELSISISEDSAELESGWASPK
jgi:hypothetical protein